jgi:3-deoxy-D-manno-octulosonic-acid transferase
MERILLFIYETALTVLLVLVGPFLLLNQKARAGLGQKLGFVPAGLAAQLKKLSNPVWFHAVSVGEFNAAWPLIQAFRERFPETPMVISTTTRTGQELAVERAGKLATIIYFPFDLNFIVERWLELVRPSLVAILETELWPCFMDACYKRNIPVIMLNGRISPRSYRMHNLGRPLSSAMLRKFAMLGAQSESEANRYRAIGGNNLPVCVFGNLKYDNLAPISSMESAILKAELNIHDDDLVLVAGSTHESEESLVLNVLDALARSPETASKTLRVIIAPRHPERFERVKELITSAGFSLRTYSLRQGFQSKSDVFLLDTIGSLSKFYSLASLAFVGGTIAKVGGHNLVEPYAYGVPVVCGPSLFKTKDVAAILLERNALLIGEDSRQIIKHLLKLLSNSELRRTIGNNGKAWLSENQGAVARAMTEIETLVEKRAPNAVKKRAAVV